MPFRALQKVLGLLQGGDSGEGLLRRMEEYHPETYLHMRRTAVYSELIGMRLSLPQEELETLRQGALLHDIGKLTLSKELLNRKVDPGQPSTLTQNDIAEILSHPHAGYDILMPDEEAAHIALYHHRRKDGYPADVPLEDMTLFADIVAVADTYDAMTGKRTYRTTPPRSAALAAIQDTSRHLERCGRALADILSENPLLTDALTSGLSSRS